MVRNRRWSLSTLRVNVLGNGCVLMGRTLVRRVPFRGLLAPPMRVVVLLFVTLLFRVRSLGTLPPRVVEVSSRGLIGCRWRPRVLCRRSLLPLWMLRSPRTLVVATRRGSRVGRTSLRMRPPLGGERDRLVLRWSMLGPLRRSTRMVPVTRTRTWWWTQRRLRMRRTMLKCRGLVHVTWWKFRRRMSLW